MSDAFYQTLEQIAKLALRQPHYQFEYIQPYVDQLLAIDDQASWCEGLYQQWQQMALPRQEACQQLFDYALLLAKQATYEPVNELDAFLERQLYGVQDTQAAQKGLVSQALKQYESSRRPPPAATRHPGRTNPLSPRNLPKPPEG